MWGNVFNENAPEYVECYESSSKSSKKGSKSLGDGKGGWYPYASKGSYGKGKGSYPTYPVPPSPVYSPPPPVSGDEPAPVPHYPPYSPTTSSGDVPSYTPIQSPVLPPAPTTSQDGSFTTDESLMDQPPWGETPEALPGDGNGSITGTGSYYRSPKTQGEPGSANDSSDNGARAAILSGIVIGGSMVLLLFVALVARFKRQREMRGKPDCGISTTTSVTSANLLTRGSSSAAEDMQSPTINVSPSAVSSMNDTTCNLLQGQEEGYHMHVLEEDIMDTTESDEGDDDDYPEVIYPSDVSR